MWPNEVYFSVSLAVHILQSILQCLDTIGQKIHQQQIWCHYINFEAKPQSSNTTSDLWCVCMYIYIYIYIFICKDKIAVEELILKFIFIKTRSSAINKLYYLTRSDIWKCLKETIW